MYIENNKLRLAERMFRMKLITVMGLFVGLFLSGYQGVAQSVKAKQGAVLKLGTGIRISGAVIKNKRNGFSVLSNQMGFFSILSAEGDTLEVSAPGYTTQSITVFDYRDAIVYLIPVTQLNEVVIQGKSLSEELNEVKEGYRSKGVYYNGKPPLLASVIHPLTAINELFGKNAKRARRFNDYAQREIEYQEVSRRFNDLTIKKTVPIPDAELADFKARYMPSLEDIQKWNDYDLVVYIKNAYNEYLESKKHPGIQDSLTDKKE